MGATAPEGDTFEERWPDDAASANWLGGPSVVAAIGGLLGVLTVPLVLASFVLAQPLVGLALVGLVALGVAMGRRAGPLERPGRWLYHLAALTLALAILGVGIWMASLVLLAAACPTGCDPSRSEPDNALTVVQVALVVASVLGSIILAFGVAKAGRRWVHPPVPRDLAAEAWVERRRSRPGAKDD